MVVFSGIATHLFGFFVPLFRQGKGNLCISLVRCVQFLWSNLISIDATLLFSLLYFQLIYLYLELYFPKSLRTEMEIRD